MKAFLRKFVSRDGGFVKDGPLGIAAAISAAFLIGNLIYTKLTTPSGVPVIMHSAEVEKPIFAGEDLHVSVFRTKLRDDCPVQSERFAIAADGRVHILESLTWEGGPAGIENFNVSYPTPVTLPSGDYTLRVRLTYLCPEETFLIEQPDVTFTVLEPKDDL